MGWRPRSTWRHRATRRLRQILKVTFPRD
jgi:hypothetical protein